MTSVLSTNERKSDDSKRPAVNPAPLNVKHFYQNKRLATEVSLQGSQHMLLANDTVLAQLGTAGEARILQVSHTNSVLGARSESAAYSPYGHLAVGQMVALLGFNGQWQDPISQTYPLGNGHRLFHTSIARFLSPDSLSPFGEGGINSYAYCAGDPINFTDPSGQLSINFFGRRISSKPSASTLPNIENKISKISQSDISDQAKTIQIKQQLIKLDAAIKQAGTYIKTQSGRLDSARVGYSLASGNLLDARRRKFDPWLIQRLEIKASKKMDRVVHYEQKIEIAETHKSKLIAYKSTQSNTDSTMQTQSIPASSAMPSVRNQ